VTEFRLLARPSHSGPRFSDKAFFAQSDSGHAAYRRCNPIFRDIAAQAGLTASQHFIRRQHYVVESMSGGIGLFDCDMTANRHVMVNGSTVDRLPSEWVIRWLRLASSCRPEVLEHYANAGIARKGLGYGVAVPTSTMTEISISSDGTAVNAPIAQGQLYFEDVTDKAEFVAAGSHSAPGPITIATAMLTCSFPVTFTWT